MWVLTGRTCSASIMPRMCATHALAQESQQRKWVSKPGRSPHSTVGGRCAPKRTNSLPAGPARNSLLSLVALVFGQAPHKVARYALGAVACISSRVEGLVTDKYRSVGSPPRAAAADERAPTSTHDLHALHLTHLRCRSIWCCPGNRLQNFCIHHTRQTLDLRSCMRNAVRQQGYLHTSWGANNVSSLKSSSAGHRATQP
jgi:hypothetical protein